MHKGNRKFFDCVLMLILTLGVLSLYLTESVTPHPRYAGILYHLGIEAENNHFKAKAKNYYKRTIRFDPLFADAYFRLGVRFREEGKPMEAMAFLQKAAYNDFRYFKNFDDFGLFYLDEGNYEEAISYFQISIRMTHRNLSRYYLGIAYLKSGNNRKAVDLATEIYLKGDPLLSEKLQTIINGS